MSLYAIDPGINGCGLARFIDNELEYAMYIENVARKSDTLATRVHVLGYTVARTMEGGVEILVTECPQIYAAGKGKGNPNQLIPLAQLGAYVAACFPQGEWVQVLPRTWKGTANPDVMTERIKARLSIEELARVQSFKRGGLDHNIFDAIGIGLHYLGRLKPRNVYPR